MKAVLCLLVICLILATAAAIKGFGHKGFGHGGYGGGGFGHGGYGGGYGHGGFGLPCLFATSSPLSAAVHPENTKTWYYEGLCIVLKNSRADLSVLEKNTWRSNNSLNENFTVTQSLLPSRQPKLAISGGRVGSRRHGRLLMRPSGVEFVV
uniref:Putative cuticle-like 1 protein n=1 Tax=Amblyomma triste TaxID=251400 RepID=A0A023G4X9_AMBTT